MKTIRNLALLSLPLALATSVSAQSTDAASTPATGHAGFARRAPPAGAGAPKAVLFDNGSNITTQTGVGSGGADVSEIEPGLIIFGYGHQGALGYRVADDFDVPSGETWDLAQIRWLTYQTGAPTTGTLTGITTEYLDGSPSGGGSNVAGDTTTNRFVSQVWTGVYRVTSTTLLDSQRAVIEVTADASFASGLTAGNYWLSVNCTGTLASGPWAPPTVPWDATDNGEQFTNAWALLTGGQGGAPADFPFVVEGALAGGGGGPQIYCTAKVTSCGSTPTIGGPALRTSVSASGPGTYDVTLVPVAANNNRPKGILIYTTNGQLATPLSGPFGFTCIDTGPGFFRVPETAVPVGSGCTASFTWDFGNYLATQTQDPALSGALSAIVDMQAWYRDPPNTGTANLSNAMKFIVVP